jgi:large subunit ribosomal protein L13Ae
MFLIQPQRLSHEVGWGYKDVVDRLEEKRKIRAKAFHERKVITKIMLWSMLF